MRDSYWYLNFNFKYICLTTIVSLGDRLRVGNRAICLLACITCGQHNFQPFLCLVEHIYVCITSAKLKWRHLSRCREQKEEKKIMAFLFVENIPSWPKQNSFTRFYSCSCSLEFVGLTSWLLFVVSFSLAGVCFIRQTHPVCCQAETLSWNRGSLLLTVLPVLLCPPPLCAEQHTLRSPVGLCNGH